MHRIVASHRGRVERMRDAGYELTCIREEFAHVRGLSRLAPKPRHALLAPPQGGNNLQKLTNRVPLKALVQEKPGPDQAHQAVVLESLDKAPLMRRLRLPGLRKRVIDPTSALRLHHFYELVVHHLAICIPFAVHIGALSLGKCRIEQDIEMVVVGKQVRRAVWRSSVSWRSRDYSTQRASARVLRSEEMRPKTSRSELGKLDQSTVNQKAQLNCTRFKA